MDKTITSSFVIPTEVAEAHTGEVAEFLYQRLVLPRRKTVENIQRTTFNHEHTLSFRLKDLKGKWHVDTAIKIGKTIEVNMVPSNEAVPPSEVLDELKDDIFITVHLFEEQLRRKTIYFAWVEGIKIIPEKAPFRKKRIFDKILFGNMIFLFIIFIVFSVFLFVLLEPFVGIYVPLVLVGVQFLIVLVAAKIIARGADWTITEQNPNVHVLSYKVPPEENWIFREKLSKDVLMKIKTEIYQETLARGKPIDCQTAQQVFSNYGLACIPENMSTKIINVYKLVKTVAEKFEIPIPKIVVSNTVIPNAAATGPSPRHGMVLITTGLLVQLKEEELLAVIGHEFSHLIGRDPLILFGLTATEYLFRFYFIWPIILVYDVLYFYLYFLLALSVIYFIAKFFEARADLVSAIRMGTPQVLAGALRKIGFKRLRLEKAKAFRFQTWVGLDPHPPIYFRIDRLEKLQPTVNVKYPLLRSIKDCINGFFASF